MEELKQIIRDIPDFPKKGIIFKDITTLLADAASFQRMIDLMSHRYIGKKIDKVVGVEARGFIIGAALAYKLGAGVVLVRKPGKLPGETFKKIMNSSTVLILLKSTPMPLRRGSEFS